MRMRQDSGFKVFEIYGHGCFNNVRTKLNKHQCNYLECTPWQEASRGRLITVMSNQPQNCQRPVYVFVVLSYT